MRRLALLVPMLLAGTAATAAQRSPRAIVEASIAAINRHDVVALAALYADDAVVIASDSCQPAVGPAAVRAGHEALVGATPDLSFGATEWVVQGDHVAVLLTARSQSIKPGGEMTLADFLTVMGGKIVRDVTIFNPGSPCR